MQFEWKPEYNLNIKIIDYQHQQFVKLINELVPEIEHVHADKETIDKVFQKIDDYIHFHFHLEEKYFEQFHYAAAPAHIREHHKFAKQIEALKKKFENDDVTTKFDLIDHLSGWLIHHIYTVDKKYVDCFHEHGIK